MPDFGLKHSETYKLTATTFQGLEEVLADEIRELGGNSIEVQNRAVSFTGEDRMIYSANLHCRTALRILKLLHQFKAQNAEKLYKQTASIPWERYFGTNRTIAVESVVNSGFFRNSVFISQKVKDAVVDRFRKSKGKRPSVDIRKPDIRIYVHIREDQCRVFLDSSGDSLHRRGYRLERNPAPLNEVLAAGLVKLSEWDGKSPFMDAMCGSGTILIEAAMMAAGQAPGLLREKFGFMKWERFDQELWRKIRNQAKSVRQPLPSTVTGSDISEKFIRIAGENCVRAGLGSDIRLSVRPFEKRIPETEDGTLIMNPPYGERMEKEDINSFYKSIGDKLKNDFSGWSAWVLSSNYNALKHIGLRPTRKITLYNGPLECSFRKFRIYKGSMKEKHRRAQEIG